MLVTRNPELEAEIVRTDDPEVYRVYADWLIERGDPHGELIAVDLARETRPDDVGLASARDVLLYKHRDEWLGALPAQTQISYRWRRGYIDAVTIDCDDRRFPTGWSAIRGMPIASWMRSLEIRGHVATDELATLLDAPPPRLASLLIGAQVNPELEYYDMTNLDELVDPLAKSALLRQLRVLDLSRSLFGDDGARVMCRHANAYRHLERIEVGESNINLAMVAELREHLPCVSARWHPFAG